MDLSPLDYMMKKFPEIKERDEMRKIVGRYGITGKQQVISVKSISRKFIRIIYNISYFLKNILDGPYQTTIGWSKMSCCFCLVSSSSSTYVTYGRTY